MREKRWRDFKRNRGREREREFDIEREWVGGGFRDKVMRAKEEGLMNRKRKRERERNKMKERDK